MKRFTILSIPALLLTVSMVFAAVPQLINFQGVLKDGSGNPVADASYSVTFTIYDAATGGNNLWTESQSVSTTSGLFAVLLGSSNPIPDTAFKGANRWLGIAVSPDGEMPTRQQLVSIGYAYRVSSVDSALGGNLTGDLTVTGNVGIGTMAPTQKLHVVGGNLNLDASSATAGNVLKGGVPFIHNFGFDNTFIGRNAGNLTMTGSNNTASGFSALTSNTTGFSNTASGSNALRSNTTSSFNTASGAFALFGNTTGGGNTASGVSALFDNTTGAGNTASGASALRSNTTGNSNTASGVDALRSNTTGNNNTASGRDALTSNTTGSNNTAIGSGANVSAEDLTNATAIGNGALVDASNKIRLGNSDVTVIEGQVAYTFPSDKNQKENFRLVDGKEVLIKLRDINLTSWNYKGHDPKQFRHYGPMAQEFYAAFGNDGVGKIGTETTLNSGDVAGILMIAVQALGDENAELKIRMEQLEKKLKELQAEKPQAEVR